MLCKKAYKQLIFYATVTTTQINIVTNNIDNRLYVSLLWISNKTKLFKAVILNYL